MSNATATLPSDDSYSEALALAEGLFPHQVEGIAFLLGRKRAILADDMGLGKTRQAILAMAQSTPAGPYLVICPASVKCNWQREIEIALGAGTEVRIIGPGAIPVPGFSGWVIVNYDILSRHLDQLRDHTWAGLVFDEAHYLKNNSSKRSRAGARLVEDLEQQAPVFALSGTPITNRPRDLFPLLKIIRHPMGRSFLSFAKRYCNAYRNQYGWVTDGASNLEELTMQLQGSLLRREKANVLNLPPKLRSWLDIDVPLGTAGRETGAVVLELIRSRARQRLGEPAGSSHKAGGSGRAGAQLLAKLTKARHKIAVAKAKATIELVEGAVAQGEKVIVFSCFEEPLRQIHEHFAEQAVLLTGKTPTKKRQALVDSFQEDPNVSVFCANLIAGGVGLNLTAARQVVFNDLDWVPANHWQAEDRAYRIGQTETVNVHYLIAAGTIDDFVKQVLTIKSALVTAVVDAKGLADVSGRNVLDELEAALSAISPQLADRDPADLDNETLADLLRDAAKTWRESQDMSSPPGQPKAAPELTEAVIMALAQALRGPQARRFRICSNSQPGLYYLLEEIGGDVLCSCPGFEYRGACSHARKLKEALVNGDPLPAGFSEHGNDG